MGSYTLKCHTLLDKLKPIILKTLTGHFELGLVLYDSPQHIIIHI